MIDVITFDFEDSVASLLPEVAEAPQINGGLGIFGKVDPKLRTVVCRHWLQGLCQKGDKCDFLHKMVKSKMPPCRHGKICKIKNCPLKHEEEEERAECALFRQGFCFNGPTCKLKHIKRPPDECPVIASFSQYLPSCNIPQSKKRKTHQPTQHYKIIMCKHWLEHGTCQFGEECHYAHGEAELNVTNKSGVSFEEPDIYDPTRNLMTENALSLPFDGTSKASYFLLHSPDIMALCSSYQTGFWGVSCKIASEMNVALKSSEHCVLFFLVRHLRGIYGVATLSCGSIPLVQSGNNLSRHPMYIDIPVRWMRTVRAPIKIVSQLKVGGGVGIGRSVVDCRVKTEVGYELFLVCYRKPEWRWFEAGQCELAVRGIAIPDTARASADAMFPDRWVDHSLSVQGPPTPFPFAAGLPPPLAQAPEEAAETSYYKGSLAGFVFGCTRETIEECFSRMLFGLPLARKAEVLQSVQTHTPLFLQDVSSGLLYGLFEASAPPQENIDASAWSDGSHSQSALPAQVRFAIALEVAPLPPLDPEVMRIFQGRMPPQRVGSISLRETRALANRFAVLARVWFPPASPPPMGPADRGQSAPPFGFNRGQQPPPSFTPQGRGNPAVGGSFQGGASGGRMQTPHMQVHNIYKPPFENVENVYIDIPFSGDGFHLRKRLLGQQASKVIAIANEFGTPQSVKIRLRGRGSGFREGQLGEELNEMLHFVVSTERADVLPLVAERVRSLVEEARREAGY